MVRIQLRIYDNPGQAEVMLSLKRTDSLYERLTAVVDTGAAVSLLPLDLFEELAMQQETPTRIIIERAGGAAPAFEATEAVVTVFLEDPSGARTPEFTMRAWFAHTTIALLGFQDVLDRAVFHLDTAITKTGWLELHTQQEA